MNIWNFYGEFVYILSNYEKGRIPTAILWSRVYLNSVQESVDIMKYFTELMIRGDAVKKSELERIADFINNNEGKIFIRSLNDIPISIDIPTIGDKAISILNLIYELLTGVQNALTSRKRGYKKQVACLLRKLHNLPRYFVSDDCILRDNASFGSRISYKDAIEFSK